MRWEKFYMSRQSLFRPQSFVSESFVSEFKKYIKLISNNNISPNNTIIGFICSKLLGKCTISTYPYCDQPDSPMFITKCRCLGFKTRSEWRRAEKEWASCYFVASLFKGIRKQMTFIYSRLNETLLKVRE